MWKGDLAPAKTAVEQLGPRPPRATPSLDDSARDNASSGVDLSRSPELHPKASVAFGVAGDDGYSWLV